MSREIRELPKQTSDQFTSRNPDNTTRGFANLAYSCKAFAADSDVMHCSQMLKVKRIHLVNNPPYSTRETNFATIPV